MSREHPATQKSGAELRAYTATERRKFLTGVEASGKVSERTFD